jgi:hypothetical protein
VQDLNLARWRLELPRRRGGPDRQVLTLN